MQKKVNSNTLVVFAILLMMLIIVSITTHCGEKKTYKRNDYKSEQYKQFNIHSLKDLKYSTRIVIDELAGDED